LKKFKFVVKNANKFSDYCIDILHKHVAKPDEYDPEIEFKTSQTDSPFLDTHQDTSAQVTFAFIQRPMNFD